MAAITSRWGVLGARSCRGAAAETSQQAPAMQTDGRSGLTRQRRCGPTVLEYRR